MPEAVWIDRSEDLEELGRALATHCAFGLDTEFLRERTFFPRLCLVQIAAGDRIWCIDALQSALRTPLAALLARSDTRKIVHSARQDLEACRVALSHIVAPVFDTQIAAALIGMKPQIGYAELVYTLLGIELPKGQTRTDWSKRPLSAAQLVYAADDVWYLEEVAARLTERLRALGREHWALEDCAALAAPLLYEPDPDQAWKRLKGARGLAPAVRARVRNLAAWRERRALERDLPRGWVLPDAALIELAQRNPRDRAALAALRAIPARLAESQATPLLEALAAAAPSEVDTARGMPPTAEEKATLARLARELDAHAGELGLSPEVLATRAELRALVAGERALPVLTGWRREVVGLALLAALE